MQVMNQAQSNARWGFWGTLLWGVVILLVLTLTQLVAIGIYLGVRFPQLEQSEIEKLLLRVTDLGDVITMSSFAVLMVCGLLILGIIKLKRGASIVDYLALKMFTLRQFFLWLGLVIIVVLGAEIAGNLLGKPDIHDFVLQAYSSAENLILFWVAVVIIAPLIEEIIFRGFLLSGFSATFPGVIGSVFITAAIWTLIHTQYDLFYLSVLFIIGLVLGFARLKTNSLLLVVILHALINFTSLTQTAMFLSDAEVEALSSRSSSALKTETTAVL